MAGERRALLISTATYRDSAFHQLSSPMADVETLGAVLSDPAIGAYSVELLVDSESYKVNQAIESFFAAAKLDDLIVLYFSGHGFKDDNGRLYLITTDSQTRLLASTAVSAQFIREQLDRCGSKRKVIILDCCYAGAFPDGLVRGDDTVNLLDKLSGRGVAVMTAASAIGYALEGRGPASITKINDVAPSVFTGALIDGLATGCADRDGDGLIGIGELYDYVYDKVRESTPQQMPGWRGNIEGNLYLATSPRGPRPAELPAEISDAVQHPLASIRLAVVNDLISLCMRGHSGTVIAVHNALTQLAGDDSRRVTAAARSALASIDDRIKSLGIKIIADRQIPGTPEEILEVARQTADRTLAEARHVAEKTVNKAQRDASALVAAAHREEEKIIADARAQAGAIERDSQELRRRTIASCDQAQEVINNTRREAEDLLVQARRKEARIIADAEARAKSLEQDRSQAPQTTRRGRALTGRVSGDDMKDIEEILRKRGI